MSEKKISKEEAEKQAKEYFTAEYGITNYDYTEWFDVFSDTTLKDDNDDEVFDSTFWLYWRTMFAFENWHSALEMKLYFQRFIHHISGLPDFSALKFTKYNQYESLILPMQKYLEEAGADVEGMSDEELEDASEVFTLPDGKYLIVEG